MLRLLSQFVEDEARRRILSRRIRRKRRNSGKGAMLKAAGLDALAKGMLHDAGAEDEEDEQDDGEEEDDGDGYGSGPGAGAGGYLGSLHQSIDVHCPPMLPWPIAAKSMVNNRH